MSSANPKSVISHVFFNAARVICSIAGHPSHAGPNDVASCSECQLAFRCIPHSQRLDGCPPCIGTIQAALSEASYSITTLFDAETKRLAARVSSAAKPATLEAARKFLQVLQDNYAGMLRISEHLELRELLMDTKGKAGALTLAVRASLGSTKDQEMKLSTVPVSASLSFEGKINVMAPTGKVRELL